MAQHILLAYYIVEKERIHRRCHGADAVNWTTHQLTNYYYKYSSVCVTTTLILTAQPHT